MTSSDFWFILSGVAVLGLLVYALSRKKSLKEYLTQTKDLKIRGILFTIRKIDTLDYFNGSRVMLQVYDKYKRKLEANPGTDMSGMSKTVKNHYIDTLMAGVVKPSLSRKESDGEKIHVEEIFCDSIMVDRLYDSIVEHTYGKKKVLSLI